MNKKDKEVWVAKQIIDEMFLIGIAVLTTLFVLGLTFYFVVDAMQRHV